MEWRLLTVGNDDDDDDDDDDEEEEEEEERGESCSCFLWWTSFNNSNVYFFNWSIAIPSINAAASSKLSPSNETDVEVVSIVDMELSGNSTS